MVHPGQSPRHLDHDLPGVGGAQPRQLLDRDPLGALGPQEHEFVVVPGPPVTSAITASIVTLPTSGTRFPRTSADARFASDRANPSP